MGRPPRTAADRARMKEVGQRLVWVREALGASQGEMASAIGVHQTSWSLYERGKRMPDEFAAGRLITKLRISRAYLMTGSLEGVDRDLATRLVTQALRTTDKSHHLPARVTVVSLSLQSKKELAPLD